MLSFSARKRDGGCTCVCVRVVHMLHCGDCGKLKAEGGSALQSACHRAGQQHGLPCRGYVFLAEPCLPLASIDDAMEGDGCHLLVETWSWADRKALHTAPICLTRHILLSLARKRGRSMTTACIKLATGQCLRHVSSRVCPASAARSHAWSLLARVALAF